MVPVVDFRLFSEKMSELLLFAENLLNCHGIEDIIAMSLKGFMVDFWGVASRRLFQWLGHKILIYKDHGTSFETDFVRRSQQLVVDYGIILGFRGIAQLSINLRYVFIFDGTTP